MRSQPTSPTPPRRDVLGFFKSIVEFFTGVAGMVAGALGILGTVAAFALAEPRSAPPEHGGGPDGPTSSPTPEPTVTPAPTPDETVDRDAWIRAVNEECAGAALIGGLGAVESGDMSTFGSTVGLLADELRAGPTPAGFEDEVASAVGDFELAAQAAAVDDAETALQHTVSATETLTTIGVGC